MSTELIYFITGALTAIVSMWSGGIVFSRLLERREQRRLLQIRLSELLSQAYEVESWLRSLRSARLMNGPPQEEPSPMKNVNTIARLFVPELGAEVKCLNSAVVAYEAWVEQGTAEKRSNRSISQTTLDQYPAIQRAVLDGITDIASKAEILVRK